MPIFTHLDVPKENRKALDPKSRPGLYLGESEKKSGVLVWDPKTQRVFESNSTLYDYKRFGAQELLARFDGKSPIPEYYLAEEFNPEEYTSKVYSNPPKPSHTSEFAEEDDEDEDPPPQNVIDIKNEESPMESPTESVESSNEVSTIKRTRGRPRKVTSNLSPPPEAKDKEEEAPRRSERNAGKASPMYSSIFINRANLEEEKGNNQVQVPSNANVAQCDDRPEWKRGYDDDLINYALIAKFEQSDPRIPRSAAQALKSPIWRPPMQKEIDGFWNLKVWRLVPRPKPGPNIIIRNGVWTFRIKPKDDTHKARFAYDGSSIPENPEDVYAGAPKWDSIHLMCEISATLGIPLKSGDIPTAYLQADMPKQDKKYYVNQPAGFVDPEHPDYVLELLKPMYGLPVAGKAWKETWVSFACRHIGFVQMKSDPCIFKLSTDKGNVMYLALFTDDDLTCCTSPKLEEKVFKELELRFKYRNDGICTWFLGAKLIQDCTGVRISQEAFVENLIQKFDEYGIKKRDTPGETGLQLFEAEEPPDSSFPIRQLNGSLLWITKTRPEISFPVNQCCRFTGKCNQTHIDAAMHTLGYLKKYPNLGLFFKANLSYKPGDKFTMSIYVDSSFADDCVNRRSTYGYIIYVNGNFMTCKSKLTPKVAHSSTEAEYVAMSEGGKAAEGLINLIEELGFEVKKPVPLYVDNAGAREWAANPMVTNRSKHIDLRYHYIRELIARGLIEPKKIPTGDNDSDIMTKNLGRCIFWKHAKKIVHQC